MNAYTDAEIRAFHNQSWWEYDARRNGQPWPPAKTGPKRIERGPYVARQPVRDYLSEPLGGAIDYLNLPLDVLQGEPDAQTRRRHFANRRGLQARRCRVSGR